MDATPIIDGGSVAMATMLTVALIKHGWPTITSGGVIVACFVSGILLAMLLPVAKGQSFTWQVAAGAVFIGLGAAAGAAGIRAIDLKGDEKREAQTRIDGGVK